MTINDTNISWNYFYTLPVQLTETAIKEIVIWFPTPLKEPAILDE
jgi:hypothetical protein